MVRYPHTAVLITPGTKTYVRGKLSDVVSTRETIECNVQPDSSNYSETVNGKTIVAKYKVFFKNNYSSITTAKTFEYAGIEYDIIQSYITQLDVQLRIG